jgi:hypothetical protein
MSQDNDMPMLQRPAFFPGQRLTADDLAATQQYHRELRWLHNRSLHGWGIVFGYAVTGVRGERSVSLEPGYALDCLGRDLILSDGMEIAIPSVAGNEQGGPETFYLTASYADDSQLTAETRGGACGATGAVRRPEAPIIRWQRPDDFVYGEDIVLITIEVENCRLAQNVSGSARRDALPSSQPHIVSGEAASATLNWRLWPDEESPLGVVATVSTADAGFRTTPQYQAHIVGSRLVRNFADDMEPTDFVIDGYTHLASETAVNFEIRVVLPAGTLMMGQTNMPLNPTTSIPGEQILRAIRERLNWSVVWMGIEG